MANEIPKASRPKGDLENVKIAQGQKEASAAAEVTGHMAVVYMCWNCSANNIIPANWCFFHCWNCGALNSVC